MREAKKMLGHSVEAALVQTRVAKDNEIQGILKAGRSLHQIGIEGDEARE